jgi:hypothetical protein
MRRAQTSTEFIVLLAVILGLVVLVVSITDSFPDIGANFEDRQHRTFWELQDIGILNYEFNSQGGKLFLINNLQDTVTITAITFDESYESFVYSLDPGETILVNLSNTTTGYYSKSLTINYTNTANNAPYVVFGEFPLIGTGY